MKLRRPRKTSLVVLLAMAATMAFCIQRSAVAQVTNFPNRPVKLMVASAPGGSGDAMTRAIAEKLSLAWGQQVVVENKTGASGMIAAQTLAKAPADGYTAYLTFSSLVQNLLLQPNPGYRMQDLAPVSMVAILPNAYAVSGMVPVNTLDELLTLAKQKPGTLSYSTLGVGSSAHIVGVALNRAAGTQMIHVAYKGEANSFPDLVSGQLTTSFGTVGFYASQLSTGKVRLLAVTSPYRLRRFPNVPTFSELGFPSANLPGWAGVFLPVGTPPAVISRFSQELRKALAMPDLQTKLYDLGFEPVGNSAEEFSQHLSAEMVKWTAAIRDNNIKLD